jgi:hypothetical protein
MQSFSIPSEHSLFVADMGEPRDNDLRVVVVDLRSEPARAWEVYWACYVLYAVRNESFAKLEEGQPPGSVGERTQSALLKYASETTWPGSDAVGPGPLRHWCLYTENHCFDVVSANPPEVRELDDDQVQVERRKLVE